MKEYAKMFKLTITRPNTEPRTKEYTYTKAAHDGFDTAVTTKGRLASDITLEDDGGIIREWHRTERSNEPTVIIDMYLSCSVTFEQIQEVVPTLTRTITVDMDKYWGLSPMEHAKAAMTDIGLYAMEEIPAFILSPCEPELSAIVVALYFRRFGKMPFLLETHTVIELIDMNKAVL